MVNVNTQDASLEAGLLDQNRRQQQQADEMLLENGQAAENNDANKLIKTPAQRAIRRAFKGTAHLANLLPTGTVLVFQFLSPIFTNKGKCLAPINKSFTFGLLALCSLSCIVLSFTDSVRDSRGKVRYGFATISGLWIVDGSINLSPEEAAIYRIRILDLFHAFLTVLVFGVVALFDQNVVKCFYPTPSEEMKEILFDMPIWIGIACSVLFVLFPSRRHGIGFPLSRD